MAIGRDVTASSWRLDGTGPETYERYRVPTEFEPLARLFLSYVQLQPNDRVLDVACGTGIVARLAAERVGAAGYISGLDINGAMLEVARSKSNESKVPLHWHAGGAEALPFGDCRFDAVLCQQGLQFFSDKLLALREMHRVLKPGGRVALAVWQPLEHDPWGLAIANALARHADARAAEIAARSLGTEDSLRSLIEAAEFCGLEIASTMLTHNIRNLRHAIPLRLASSGRLAAIVEGLTAQAREAVFSEVMVALEPFRQDEHWRIPRGTFIALARRRTQR